MSGNVAAGGAAHADAGVRSFSGTATYTTTIDAQQSWLRPGRRLLLDLGTVFDVADVTVNGRAVDTLWKPPYRVDITGALRAGRNEITIAVTNQWSNRIIGDRVVPANRRVLLGSTPAGRGGGPAEPQESGLLGPVTVLG